MKKNILFICFLTFIVPVFLMTACSNNVEDSSLDGDKERAASNETENEEGVDGERVVVDMEGREVTIPSKVEKVVLIGSVPVLSTFMLTIGEGDKIANGLPDSFAKQNRWKYLPKFAPNLETEPVMQGEGHEPSMEEILQADPDLVLAASMEVVDIIENNGIPAVFLSWTEPDEVKDTIHLLGEIFHKEEQAEAYTEYFDNSLKDVEAVVETISEDKRIRVLNLNYTNLSQPHAIAEWWIAKAGGISVTDDGSDVDSKTYSIEQLLEFDPEVLIVAKPSEIDDIKADKHFENFTPVKNGKIYSTPLGAHIWANRTAEQPLMVMWAASKFYPEKFA